MSFWDSIANEETSGTFDGGGGFDPIPKGTTVHALCDSAEWAEYNGERYINLQWDVLEGQYSGRKVFQKVRVLDSDDKKKQRALRMLVAIDFNAGGKLRESGREPEDLDDMDLMRSLVSKSMLLKLDVWSVDGKTGNYVQAVSPYAGKQPEQQAKHDVNFDDDIPF